MKKIVIICTGIIIVILISISVCYVIDMNKIENNEPVVFSTWGLKYAPPINTYSFTGTIIEANGKDLLISPDKNGEINKTCDKISVFTSDDTHWEIGTRVKITYDGYIMETYPAKVNLINIEIAEIDKV